MEDRKSPSWDRGTVTRESPPGERVCSRAPAARGAGPPCHSTTNCTLVPSGLKGIPNIAATVVIAVLTGSGACDRAATNPWGRACAMAWARISSEPSTPGRFSSALAMVIGPSRNGTGTEPVGAGVAAVATSPRKKRNSTASPARGDRSKTAATASCRQGRTAPTARPAYRYTSTPWAASSCS